MKVLKFGGTSVGTPASILSLKAIVQQAAAQEPVIVVVSALGGITDKLLLTARLAKAGDQAWLTEFQAMLERHHQMIDTVIAEDQRQELHEEVDSLFTELRSIYFGVSLIHDLSGKTQDAIVSYGERISSRIAAVLTGAEWHDSRQFIKTENKRGKHLLATTQTNQLVSETFADRPQLSLIPGFISTDLHTGEITNLGRGGSDYTAAIIAAALDADVLEIWTDVDGFLTADPRVIPDAYTIDELTYTEATDLCNFGAKVIYPPTIYPVCVKNIPIWVKNTFHPEAAGSVIRQHVASNGKPVKGISSIRNVSLLTVTGLSMVGVIGVNRRIFAALADNGISVFMVAQSSSESSTSIGIQDADAAAAVEVLNAEFAREIATGSMNQMTVQSGLAAVAIVGENMKHTPGISGQLYSALGNAGISVIAGAQGATETNISVVVQEAKLGKTLHVLHDAFFLSEYQELNLFICGVGTIGSRLLDQIRMQQPILVHDKKLRLKVVGIASSQHAIYCAKGINLDDYQTLLAESLPSNTRLLSETILSMDLPHAVFVDCTASEEIAALYETMLAHQISVIAANKLAASGDYETYQVLKSLTNESVKYRFETNVGAGLPILSTIADLVNSGDHVEKIEAVLSGTLNFICSQLALGTSFEKAVQLAQEQGYTEPDPRTDLSGVDVVRKIIILAREAGYPLQINDVQVTPLYQDPGQAPEGCRWRYMATFANGKAEVRLCAVDERHPFYHLPGLNNIVTLTTRRYHEHPLIIQGYGAGASVTAAGVLANILSLANIQ